MRARMFAALLLLVSTPAAAQAGLIQEGYKVFPAVTSLEGPEPTPDAISAARGNFARWRDEERARIGPYSRESEAANIRLRSAYENARREQLSRRPRDRQPVPEPAYLPVGPLLPAIGGYFAYFYESDGVQRMTVIAGVWRDPKSNAGEASRAYAFAMLPDVFCGRRSVSLTDLAYLGPAYTSEIAAMNHSWLGQQAAPPMLNGAELTFRRTPAGATFYRYYPARALMREVEGTASLTCDIGADAALTCAVASEEPAGWGFGEAALKIAAEGYQIDPELRDGGSAIGRKVCLSTAFRLE